MKIITAEQYSQEWWDARLGVPSASCFDKIITTTGKPSAQAEKYLFKLAGERVCGKAEETYQNAAMVRGLETEAEARAMYQIIKDAEVKDVGFCLHDDVLAGCSPDGLIGEDGGLEIKCPGITAHVQYLIDGVLPTEYYQQVQGSLFVTGRKWWDFMSYYPGMRPLIVRVYADDDFQRSFMTQITNFCQKLTKTIEKIK